MDNVFQPDHFYNLLLKGELRGAISYLGQFPERQQEYQMYLQIFETKQYRVYPVNESLQKILTVYQQYYRDVFYLSVPADTAAQTMTEGLFALLGDGHDSVSPETMENLVNRSFTEAGYHILCGKTGGYFGPYIWKHTELRTYAVTLPDGIREYTVKFLSGFVSKSWLDYISFGKIGTGGWTDCDGIINCVRDAYDTQSEHFQISLLKHEAQHASDLAQYPGMSSADLEYRAKLVELIYSSDPALLGRFIKEADRTHENNGHGLASARIADAFPDPEYTLPDIQSTARSLFIHSCAEIAAKYG